MKIPSNDRIRFAYQSFMEARGADTKTIDAKLASLSLWDEIAGHIPYADLSIALAKQFRDVLVTNVSETTGLKFSASTITHHLAHNHGFFMWLSKRNDYPDLDLEAIECLSTSHGLRGIGRMIEKKPVYEVEVYSKAIAAMPAGSITERCQRVILSLLLITGVRISALTTLSLEHVNLERHCIHQNADRGRSKTEKRRRPSFL